MARFSHSPSFASIFNSITLELPAFIVTNDYTGRLKAVRRTVIAMAKFDVTPASPVLFQRPAYPRNSIHIHPIPIADQCDVRFILHNGVSPEILEMHSSPSQTIIVRGADGDNGQDSPLGCRPHRQALQSREDSLDALLRFEGARRFNYRDSLHVIYYEHDSGFIIVLNGKLNIAAQ